MKILIVAIILACLTACTPDTVFAAYCQCQVTVITEDARNDISRTPQEALSAGLAYCYSQADQGCPAVSTTHTHTGPFEVKEVSEGAVPIESETGYVIVEFISFLMVAPADTTIEHDI